jgi:hypothetical protein
LQEIIDCLKAMPKRLKGLDLCSALTNGKVEMQLKTFFGIAWVAAGHDRSYLMDKNMGKPKKKKNVNAPLDLVAFEGEVAAFWIEAKCDFEKGGSAKKSAQDAIEQVRAYKGRLRYELQDRQAYIVHFLCPVPQKSQHPKWVTVFDSLRNARTKFTTKRLKKHYHDELGPDCLIQDLTINFDPPIGVVVVKP